VFKGLFGKKHKGLSERCAARHRLHRVQTARVDDAETLACDLSVGDADRLTITASDIVDLPDFACYFELGAAQNIPQ
jgi:hypothetical protein